ncbi:MAG: transglutaminase-like domain-containing protein [Candidatus Ranarchaeia archaeon]|jgi:transglutaminase-like putative cysteine protease
MPWKISNNEGLSNFLRASELCNCNHPSLKATAERITREASNPKDAAIMIFYFVRDKIPLSFIDPWKTASETLRIGKGSCLTKATLQVALLRSVGIPARFRIMEFKGNDPEEWEGILPRFAVSRMPKRFLHYFAELYIEGRWIMADATFDKALLPDTENWNGENDIYSIEEKAILLDLGTIASIEEEAKKLDELYHIPVLWTMNSYRFFWILNLYTMIQRLRNKV